MKDFLEQFVQTFINFSGVLICIFNALVGVMMYSFFFEICPEFYQVYASVGLLVGMHVVGGGISFCLLFSYWMAILTPPGYTAEHPQTKQDYE
jgi:hypothetical protein